VPLDRTGSVAGTISLSVERKLAGESPSRTAVVALAGGPGQAADPLAPFIAEAIAPALAGRDLIVFDQRGTGTSGPLSCAALAKPNFQTNPVTRCATELGPSRGDYTSEDSVEDIEAIRKAGGYEKLVLYGTSYGTKVALEYAQRHPEHVESLVLDSTETPTGPEPFHIATYQAIRSALSELCADRACAGIAPSPLAELAAVIGRAESGALAASAFTGRGKRHSGRISPEDIFGLLLAGDLNPVLRAALPAAVHAAAHGDGAPLARLLVLENSGPSGAPSEIDSVLFLATSCEETPFPWNRAAPEATRAVEAEAALDALPASDFFPFSAESGLLDETIPTCVAWPDASPAPSTSAPLPDVPTLIFSGGQDLRTPRADAIAVAHMIPDAQIVAVPFTGHSVIGADPSDCAKTALSGFFSSGSAAPCAPAANLFPPTAAPPGGFASLKAPHGTSGVSGKTTVAALDTIADVRVAVAALIFNYGGVPVGRFGGLRGGYMTVSSTGVRLHGVVYIPGVTVSGLIPSAVLLRHKTTGAAELTIAGSAAAGGRLRLPESGSVTGRLGGHAVRARVPAHAASAAAGTSESWPGGPLPSTVGALARVP
jgi:pimeloyl-ACP methyl ester carboxylesterase